MSFSSPVVTGVVELLVGVARDTVPHLQVSAVLVHAVDDIKALGAVEDRDLTVGERPVLVGSIASTGLDVDDRAVGGALSSEAVAAVEAWLEESEAGEGRCLGRDSDRSGNSDESREHREG